MATILSALLTLNAYAQDVTVSGPTLKPLERENWEFSGSVYGYIVPEDNYYLQPTFVADRDWLHIETRYNYEDINTGSLWLGYNYSAGEKLSIELAPMLGGVVGSTMGVGFGYTIAIDWSWLALYTEGQFVLSPKEIDASYFYAWSELTLSPLDWLIFGGAAQRTRAYQSDREMEPGFLVGLTFDPMTIAGYVFNPATSTPTLVVAFDFDL